MAVGATQRSGVGMEPREDAEIVITRAFDAPRAAVFKAWTEPSRIMAWWGPKGFTSPSVKVDLRVGGKYLYCMRSPEGKDFYSGGVYREIRPNERLAVTDYFADEHGHKTDPSAHGLPADVPKEMRVAVSFKEERGKTTVTIHYAPLTPAAREALLAAQMLDGWNSSLDKLAAHLKQSRTD